MSELINKSALIESFEPDHRKDWYTPWIIDKINEQPEVDAVEVVRCKDCQHWDEETGWCKIHSHFIDYDGDACHPWESNEWKMFDPNDFCSDGERKV